MKQLVLLALLAAVACTKQAQPAGPAHPQYGGSYGAPADRPLTATVRGTFRSAWNSFAEGTDEVIDGGAYTFHRLENGGIEVWNRTKRVAGQAAEGAGDAAVLAAVKARLETTNGVRQEGIDVDVHDGVVSLHGEVPTRAAAGQAIHLALDTRGVDRVVSYLTWPGMTRYRR